jgi:hypothetical protein
MTAVQLHTPLGEDGAGLYSLSTRGCFDVINLNTDLMMETTDAVLAKIPGGGAVTFCDYGTADGGTSIPLFNKLVKKCKDQQADRDVWVFYEDQPGNEWKSVFYHALGQLKVPGSDQTYMQEHPRGVYVAAVGRSFHHQTLPDNSLHVGFAATCMHWLSALPGKLGPENIHHSQLPADDPLLLPFKEQAAKDWSNILLHRARELAVGGRLVIVNFCIDADGQCLGRSKNLKRTMYDTKRDHWIAMAKEGRITMEELANTNFPNYYRTPEETEAPLKDPNSEVYKAGLRLVNSFTRVTPCPYRASWIANPQQDAITYARDYVLTTRTWSNATYLGGLSDSRSPEEKSALVDELFERYAQDVAKSPADHGMDYCHCILTVEKV